MKNGYSMLFNYSFHLQPCLKHLPAAMPSPSQKTQLQNRNKKALVLDFMAYIDPCKWTCGTSHTNRPPRDSVVSTKRYQAQQARHTRSCANWQEAISNHSQEPSKTNDFSNCSTEDAATAAQPAL